jgi:hypothetical protein
MCHPPPSHLPALQASGRFENLVGWYHSHPGYGCWLSGIDVGTQMTNQKYQEPFLAIVVDPHRTVAAGKVEIGAFRTFPEGYKPPEEGPSEYQTIPLDKIEDFGVHCKQVGAAVTCFWQACRWPQGCGSQSFMLGGVATAHVAQTCCDACLPYAPQCYSHLLL